MPPDALAAAAVGLLLLISGFAGAARGAAAPVADRGRARPRLELAVGVQARGEVARFLREDQTWLDRQRVPPQAPPQDDREALASWVRRAAAGMAAGPGGRQEGQRASARDLTSLLRDRWLVRGYLAVHVERGALPDTTAAAPASPLLRVRPGPLFHLGSLEVEGLDFPERERLLALNLPRPGDRFTADRWQEAVGRLLAAAGEEGYPFAHWLVKDVTVDLEDALVDVRASLYPGVRAYLGPQTSDLAAGRGENFLVRASGLHRGRLFRESDLAEARRRLQARGLYSSVEEPVVYLTAAPDTVGVFWPVVPRLRANRLGVVLGYSQGRQGERGRLSGQVDLLLPNLAGTGRRLAAGWSDDGSNLSRLGFSYLEPLAFGTPLDLQASLDQEVATGAYSRLRLDGSAQLAVVAAWGVEIGLGWDRSTFPSGALERTSRLRARGAFLHHRLDLRRSGWSGAFAIETASRQAVARQDTSATSSALVSGSEERQRLLSFDIAGELWLGRLLSLAGRSSYREVRGEGGPIPLSEQYRFGGANSVRGYREDEFHGERVIYGGVELRIGQPGRSRLYTFLDMGYFEFSASVPTPDDPARREQRDGTVRGFGLGLQTLTPAGDISLAIGFPGSVNFDDAKLHVSLLEAF